MIAATGYDLLKSIPSLQASDAPLFGVGFLAAFLTAIAAIKFFVRLVKNTDFKPFGWYRIALAIVILVVMHYTG